MKSGRRQIGRIHITRDLDDRLRHLLRRLGRDYTLAYFMRVALIRAIDNPKELRPIAGPYERQLSSIECVHELIARAQAAAVEKFGERRGAYSDFVRSALEAFIRSIEAGRMPRRPITAPCDSALPQFRVSEAMAREIRLRARGEAGEGLSRFLRKSAYGALNLPIASSVETVGPYTVIISSVPAPAELVRRIRAAARGNPAEYMRRAVALLLYESAKSDCKSAPPSVS